MAFRIQVEPNEESKGSASPIHTPNLKWALQPLINWMCCLGLSPPFDSTVSSNGQTINSATYYSSHVIRITVFFLVPSIHIWLIINLCLDANAVAMAYTNGYSSGATAWNFIIDAFNFSGYVIVNLVFLIFLTRPKQWKTLTDPFKILEENSTHIEIYQKCRKMIIHLMILIVITVRRIFHI